MSYESNIWKMYLFKFFRNLHFIGGVLVPFFLDWGQITFNQLMLLNSFFLVSIFIMEIPTGAVADYFGRKTSIICAAFVSAIGVFIYSITPNIYLFMLGEFLWATGYALMSGADQALIYDSLKKMKKEHISKKIFGRLSSFEIGAIAVAAPLGSLIAKYFGLRYVMLFMAVPFLLATFIGLTFTEPKTKKKVESTRYLKLMIGGINYFRKHDQLKILAFDMIGVSIFIFFIIWLYQPLLMELGVPIIYFGFIHAIALTSSQLVFLNNFGRLEKMFGSKKRYLLFSALIAGVCFILLGFTHNISLILVLLLILSGFGLTRQVLFRSYLNKYIESHNRATVISTISMLDRFCRAIMYPIIGWMVTFSLRFTFVFVGVVVILFALVSKVEEEHLID